MLKYTAQRRVSNVVFVNRNTSGRLGEREIEVGTRARAWGKCFHAILSSYLKKIGTSMVHVCTAVLFKWKA